MSTSAVISNIKSIQAALSVIATLNICAPDFPPDIHISGRCSYDYIVVGGGTAGSVVSARLVEAGHSVLIIEAGGLPQLESSFPGWVTYLKKSRADYNYTVEESEESGGCYKSNDLPVSKGMGGIGTTDFMVYGRGNPADYDNWSKDGAWSFKNLLKYFKRSESLRDRTILNSPYRRYHGINGKIRITRESRDECDRYLKGFKRAGQPVPLDIVGKGSLGYARALYFIFNGLRTSVSSYITPIKDNPRIHLSLHSLATKIIFDDEKNAVGVEFIKRGRKITVRAKKEVIISAGPLKSPQLLMLSGIGPKNQLKKYDIPIISNLPVGQNLQNIVGAWLVFKSKKRAHPKPFDVHNYPTPLIVGNAKTNKSSKYPDYGVLGFIIDDYEYFLTFCGYTLNFENQICDRLYRQGKNRQLLVTTLNNFYPKSKGKVLLRSANPKAPPKIITGYYSNDDDLDSVVKKIRHYRKVLSTPYFKKLGLKFIDASKCSKYKKNTKKFWKCYAKCMMVGNYRHVGTNSMGAVVDSKLCVKGLNKLRVVDASVIPNTISGSIYGTIIALAEKAAEIIISDAN